MYKQTTITWSTYAAVRSTTKSLKGFLLYSTVPLVCRRGRGSAHTML